MELSGKRVCVSRLSFRVYATKKNPEGFFLPLIAVHFIENLLIPLILRLKLCKQVGPILFRAAQAHFASPCFNIGMVPGEQHLRHFSAAPVFRTGVLRMLEQAVPVAFRRERFLVRQNARHHAAYCVRDRHRRNLAAGQHKVTDGNLLVHALVDKPLVNALIMAADQNKVLLCEQLTRFLLIKRLSLCREEHRVHMLAEPLYLCHEALSAGEHVHTVFLSAQGAPFNQEKARQLLAKEHFILVCGHYEGIDQRFIDECVDEEISIGDFVLTGGEIPAMAVADAVCRMVPGVLPDEEAFTAESHWDGLLEHPQYTRPENWRGRPVPEVLLSGHHANIEVWRREMSLRRTKKDRPDLFSKFEPQDKRDRKILEKIKNDG